MGDIFNFQVGYDVAKNAADALYKRVGLGPENVQVIECHDCFSANELITYEALGLCPPGLYCLKMSQLVFILCCCNNRTPKHQNVCYVMS